MADTRRQTSAIRGSVGRLAADAVRVLAFVLLAHASEARQFGDSRHTFYSPALGHELIVFQGVFSPAEAEKQVLPYMRENEQLFKGRSVLDIGSGSGIIGLYAAKLGASKVVATDINEGALSCTRLNARRMGLDSVVETRLVSSENPVAFSVIRPDESFDIIISNPPYSLDLDAHRNSALIDRGDLGFSIVRGLDAHLKPDGTAILLYATFFYHEVIVRLARHFGYAVDHFSPDYSTPWEQDILFNSYLKRLLDREGITPTKGFEFNWLEDRRSEIRELFRLYRDVTIPKERGLYSGLIVITRGHASHKQERE